jgi:hypothetical protein
MTPSARPPSLTAVSLCGLAVPVENVRVLAAMLGDDELATKLERAITNGNTIVALSVDERQQIADVLEGPPVCLPELRRLLVVQVKMLKDRESKQQHLRRTP